MRIPANSKIEACVSDDELRPAMQHVHFTGKYAVATDGHVLVQVPVEADEKDTPGAISVDAIKQARKVNKTIKADKLTILCNGNLSFADESTLRRPDPGNFPNYDMVLQPVLDRKPGVKFGVNVSLLVRAAQALGTEFITIELPDEPEIKSAILVRPDPATDRTHNPVEDAVAIVMPRRIR